jgi:hypothetical protein
MDQTDAPDGINVRFWLGPDNFPKADDLDTTARLCRYRCKAPTSTRSAYYCFAPYFLKYSGCHKNYSYLVGASASTRS